MPRFVSKHVRMGQLSECSSSAVPRCQSDSVWYRIVSFIKGNIDLIRRKANADYYTRLGIMKTVTLINAKGELLLHESIGNFIEPEPEPENNEEPNEG